VGYGFRTATERIACLALDERVDTPARHVVDRALELAAYLTGRSDHDRVPDVKHLVERPDEAVDAFCALAPPFALLQPFASRREKEWREDELVPFARALRAGTGLAAVVRWGPGERERAEALVHAIGEGALLAPPAPPAASARLASRARLFVGADTGPTHLAAAAGTPTVALFGPTDPARFAPIGPRVRVLRTSDAVYDRSLGTHVPPEALLSHARSLIG
jgi:ADP-heptose:LPS heptosyltransferase